MPGTSLRTPVRDPSHRTGFRDGLSALRHDERYETAVVADAEVMAGYSGYPEYPVRTFEVGGCTVIFEGHVYDRSDAALRRELEPLVQALAAGVGYEDRLARWLPTVDGDFVVTVLDEESGWAAVLTDYLGRLPLYYAETDDGALLSRELRFVVEGLADVSFDRLALAQYLLFGYTVGERTFVEGAERVPPASLVWLSADGVAVESVCEHEYETTRHARKSRGENADALAERFDEACRNRSETVGESLVSLSGGLDSRAILASYAEQELPHVAATMDHAAVPAVDVSIARDLSDAYGTEWSRYEVGEPDARVFDRQVKTRNGRDPLSISYLTVFFDRLLEDYGSMPHLVGAGGDKVLPDLTPSRRLRSVDDLVDYLVTSYGQFDLETIEALTGVDPARLRASLRAHVAAYPESSMAAKYVHFLVHERAMSWIFEAEDTNRYYFWSMSPFWSAPVFRYAMNCPPSQKRYYRLYGEFLEALSPTATAFDNANFGAPPASLSHTLRAFGYETILRYPGLFEAVKPAVKRLIGSDNDAAVDDDVVRCMRRQLDNAELGAALSTEALDSRILSDPSRFSPRQVYNLFTVTSYVDDVTAELSTLETLRLIESGEEAAPERDSEAFEPLLSH